MASWPSQEAKAKFSELVDEALKNGPQMVTRRGVEAVVVVPVEQWRRMQEASRPTLKELLLDYGPKFEMVIPSRKSWRLQRRPLEFE